MRSERCGIIADAHFSERHSGARKTTVRSRRPIRIPYGVRCNQHYRCCFDVEFSTARTGHHGGSHPLAMVHETFNLTTAIEYRMGVLNSGAQWRVYVCVWWWGEGRSLLELYAKGVTQVRLA